MALCGPRRTSIRSISSASSEEKSNSDPFIGSLTSTPSMITSVWLPSAPRMRTWVTAPTLPARLTATPGTWRRMSETNRTCLRSICSAVMTVMALPTSLVATVVRLAVTTNSGRTSDSVD